MIGSIRETGLVMPFVGGASIAVVLLATAACVAPSSGAGDWTDGWAIRVELPPSPDAVLLATALQPITVPADGLDALDPWPPVPLEKPGLVLSVAPGDTLDGIASRYGVPSRTIIALNELSYPYWLQTGQRIRLPREALAAARPVEVEATVVAAPAPPAERNGRLAYADLMSSSSATHSDLSAVPLPPTRNTFLWPTEGPLISEFGVKPGGRNNDGINVAVPVGSAIRAAQNGIVAYAGNELRGYGNLVLIRHEDGWMTAYAHNDSLLVGKGDVVRRGQVISRSGKSGRVSRPQAHFEIRRNGEPHDPLRLFTRK